MKTSQWMAPGGREQARLQCPHEGALRQVRWPQYWWQTVPYGWSVDCETEKWIWLDPLRKYDVISISQDGGRDGWILLPVSYLLMSLPSEGQSLLANQILSRYLKWRLRYIFMAIQNGLGRGQHFFQNQQCVNIMGCSVIFYEYKNVFLMLVD